MTTFTINVTQHDINHGERDKCKRCPIALAMQRTFPLLGSSVYTTDVWLSGHGFIMLPPEARYFIGRFDAEDRENIHPFSFELDLDNKSTGDI
jgi:hypothetical protein